MPWPRNEPDPLDSKRRELEEQQRLLQEKLSRLTHQLHNPADIVDESRPSEPPVWRLEEDTPPAFRQVEQIVARKRNLAKHRQRDRIVFFLCVVALLVAIAIFLWLHSHYASLNSSA